MPKQQATVNLVGIRRILLKASKYEAVNTKAVADTIKTCEYKNNFSVLHIFRVTQPCFFIYSSNIYLPELYSSYFTLAEHFKGTFFNRIPYLWNNLPDALRTTNCSVSSFKRLCSIFYKDRVFDPDHHNNTWA